MRRWTLPAAIFLLWARSASAAEFDANIDLAEWHLDSDHSLYVDSSFSYGDDAQMLVAKLTAGASVGAQLDEVDGQLLYARAIGRGFAVLAGVRHEFVPGPRWSYAALGIEGLAIKNLAVESYAFLSQKGDLTGEFKAVHDLPLAPRLNLQPRAAVGWAAQDIPRQGLASGLTALEIGMRLRIELADGFAPYAGLSHERLLGRTSAIARSAGDPQRATHAVIGFSSSF